MNSPATWRLFVGIRLPDAVRRELGAVQGELRAAVGDDSIRWTRAEQCHITLKFLGNVPVELAAKVAARLSVAAKIGPLRLRAHGVGFFPNARFPRVIWAGVADEDGRLQALHRVVDEACRAVVPVERERESFTGHITLGRVQGLRQQAAEALEMAARRMDGRDLGCWTVGNFELIRSELGTGGSRYTSVLTIALLG